MCERDTNYKKKYDTLYNFGDQDMDLEKENISLPNVAIWNSD